MFKKKQGCEIDTLLLNNSSRDMIRNAGIDINELPVDQNNNFVVSNEQNKMAIMGEYFASIGKKNVNMGQPRLNEIIKRKQKNLKKI